MLWDRMRCWWRGQDTPGVGWTPVPDWAEAEARLRGHRNVTAPRPVPHYDSSGLPRTEGPYRPEVYL